MRGALREVISTIGFKFLCLPALIGLVLVIVGIIILSTIGSSSCPGCGKTDSYCCVSGQNMCYCQDDGAYSPEDYYCKHVTVNDSKAGRPLIGGGCRSHRHRGGDHRLLGVPCGSCAQGNCPSRVIGSICFFFRNSRCRLAAHLIKRSDSILQRYPREKPFGRVLHSSTRKSRRCVMLL
jgi:hypothetical protein